MRNYIANDKVANFGGNLVINYKSTRESVNLYQGNRLTEN